MDKFLSFLKVSLPLLAQILGLCFTVAAATNKGRADTSGATVGQQAVAIYGQAALGLALWGGGTAAQQVIAARDKAKAEGELPTVPPGTKDAILHTLTVAQGQMVLDPKTTQSQLKKMSELIDERRQQPPKEGT